ncbi:MAG TPA: hypothetical protein VH062_36830 [Polyangiaceae bacterium]|nr:hypothetical protein [Polyangiaceae bacterium]
MIDVKIAVAVGIVSGLVLVGAFLYSRQTIAHLEKRLAMSLAACALPAAPVVTTVITDEALSSLPEPARLYLAFMGVVGRPPDWWSFGEPRRRWGSHDHRQRRFVTRRSLHGDRWRDVGDDHERDHGHASPGRPEEVSGSSSLLLRRSTRLQMPFCSASHEASRMHVLSAGVRSG